MTADDGFTRYQKSLLAIFLVLWVILAVRPYYRQDWLLENILVAILVPTGLLIVRYFRLSNLSYTLITLSSHPPHRGCTLRPLGEVRLRELIRAHKQRQTNTP
jgi:hypothetical protein